MLMRLGWMGPFARSRLSARSRHDDATAEQGLALEPPEPLAQGRDFTNHRERRTSEQRQVRPPEKPRDRIRAPCIASSTHAELCAAS